MIFHGYVKLPEGKTVMKSAKTAGKPGISLDAMPIEIAEFLLVQVANFCHRMESANKIMIDETGDEALNQWAYHGASICVSWFIIIPLRSINKKRSATIVVSFISYKNKS